MSFDATAAAGSVRRDLHSMFRKRLKCTVFTALLLITTCSGIVAQALPKYLNADGTRTNDLEAAKKSWRDEKEFNGNWGLKAINADAAYARGYTGNNAKIGVIDQPVWTSHPEFSGKDKLTFITIEGTRLYTDPYTLVKAGDPFKYDGQIYVTAYKNIASHGTHVAGISAAKRDGKTMHGVAFDARIFAVDNGDPGPEDGIVLGNDGAVYAKSFDAMIDSGVGIITNSWGIGVKGITWTYVQAHRQFKEINAILGKPEGGAYNGAIKAAHSGIVVEFSAGNDGGLEPDAMAGLATFVPDIEKYWLSTTWLKQDAGSPGGVVVSGGSSICGYTKYYCVGAPGEKIYSSVPTGDATGLKPGDIVSNIAAGYAQKDGSSMAGPFATGAFGVLKQRFSYLANGEINDILKTTSTDLGDAGIDRIYGWGLINLQKAMDGPGQFLGRFEANLPASHTGDNVEIWSNDISQAALDQRKTEETKEIADWKSKKTATGLDDGYSDAELQTEVDGYKKNAASLLKALATTIKTGKFDKELRPVQDNVVASIVFTRLLSKTSYPTYFAFASDPKHLWIAESIGGDLLKLLEDKDFSISDSDIEDAKSFLKGQFEVLETRSGLLAKRLADPALFDAGLTKSGALALCG